MAERPIKIVYIVTRSDAIGGASIHVRDMAARMRHEGHDARVILGTGEELTRLLAEAEVPYFQEPSFGRALHPLRDLKALIGIYRKLREWRPDLVSTHTSKAGFLGRAAAWLLRIPVLYTPHCWSFTEGFPRAGLYRFLERLAAFTTTRFVAVSEFERRQGIDQGVCSERNCITIHNGMPAIAGASAFPGNDPPRLVMVARFEQQKDHRTLIEALAELRELQWELQLVGDGPLRGEIEALVAERELSERVEFAGQTDAVAELLGGAQLFVLATRWESFPRSILEALRAGLPVVASDIGGCSESVIDGVNGAVVPPGDPVALRDALEPLVRDAGLRCDYGAASRRIFDENFTFEIMVSKYISLYESILAGESS